MQTNDESPEREFWPIPEFCAAHGLSKTTVYELLAAKRLEAVKVGSKTLITEESRKRWCASLPRFRSTAELAQAAA